MAGRFASGTVRSPKGRTNMNHAQTYLNTSEVATLLGISKNALHMKLQRRTFPSADKRITTKPGRPRLIWSLNKIKHHIALNDKAIEEKIKAIRATQKEKYSQKGRDSRVNKIETVKLLKEAGEELKNNGHPDLYAAVKFAARLINQIPGQDFKKAALKLSR